MHIPETQLLTVFSIMEPPSESTAFTAAYNRDHTLSAVRPAPTKQSYWGFGWLSWTMVRLTRRQSSLDHGAGPPMVRSRPASSTTAGRTWPRISKDEDLGGGSPSSSTLTTRPCRTRPSPSSGVGMSRRMPSGTNNPQLRWTRWPPTETSSGAVIGTYPGLELHDQAHGRATFGRLTG